MVEGREAADGAVLDECCGVRGDGAGGWGEVAGAVLGGVGRDPRLLHAGNCAARGFGPTDEHGLPGFRRGSRGARRSPRFGLMHSLHVLTRLSLLRLHLAHVRAERGYGACPARAR